MTNNVMARVVPSIARIKAKLQDGASSARVLTVVGLCVHLLELFKNVFLSTFSGGRGGGGEVLLSDCGHRRMCRVIIGIATQK